MPYRLCVWVALGVGALRFIGELLMPQDPRLDSLMQYAVSELGVGPLDETAQLRQRVENLERTLAVVLRTPNVQEVGGTPTVAARNGTLAVDTGAARLWVRRNGAWQFATLT